MDHALEIECTHCRETFAFRSRCDFALDDEGAARLLATPERDAQRWFGTSVQALKAQGRLRRALPTVCLDCGHLGAHRADHQWDWQCDKCESCNLYQLGVDLRPLRLIGGAFILLVLVVLPGASAPLHMLPGLVTLALFLHACAWLKRRGDSRLAQAPCTTCGHHGLVERPSTDTAASDKLVDRALNFMPLADSKSRKR